MNESITKVGIELLGQLKRPKKLKNHGGSRLLKFETCKYLPRMFTACGTIFDLMFLMQHSNRPPDLLLIQRKSSVPFSMFFSANIQDIQLVPII